MPVAAALAGAVVRAAAVRLSPPAHLLLKREGWEVNWKKLYRIYREERLTVRKRGGRKRASGTRAPMAIPQDPNQRWSLDFVSDTLVDGRRFRILCVIDDFSRECLATVVDNSISGERVARELDADRRTPRLSLHGGQRQRHGADLERHARNGRRTAMSSGTTSRPASPCRTASWRASTAG
jgi:transposase InsO family protein